MKKTLLIALFTALLAAPHLHAILGVGDVVSDPVVEEASIQNNLFQQIKYTWEQSQWAQNLATLHNTLTTVREQLQTAERVRQAIGDPNAVGSLVDNELFSSYLKSSGITETLSDLSTIAEQGATLSGTIHELFVPIDIAEFKNLQTPFEGTASFRDASDPLKQYRALENAYSRFEELIFQAESKRTLLKDQVALLNSELKGAPTDAEVQKLIGSLHTAETSLNDLNTMEESAQHQVELLHLLNQNREAEEQVAAEEISRSRNQESARLSAQEEAAMPDLSRTGSEQVVGF